MSACGKGYLYPGYVIKSLRNALCDPEFHSLEQAASTLGCFRLDSLVDDWSRHFDSYT